VSWTEAVGGLLTLALLVYLLYALFRAERF
jgi:K+-transporting ATPase KdpF subunit